MNLIFNETIKIRDDTMKKAILLTLGAIGLSVSAGAFAADHQATELPFKYETVFDQAMDDPNVMIYYADQAYRKGDYATSLRWMLGAAQYEHPAAISNAKHMIEHSLGSVDNRGEVISFLGYYAEPRGDEQADIFAQRYLADFYRGDRCVWFAPKDKTSCVMDQKGPMAGNDLRKSYFYYEGAAQQGDVYSRYVTGMMNLLGIGSPRNVALGLEWLRPLAEGGNTSVAYLIGSVYQLGYWMPMDRAEASRWFKMAADSKHPGSLLYLGKNAESGVFGENEAERESIASKAYNEVFDGLLANVEQRSEAHYRFAIMEHANKGDVEHAREHMSEVVRISAENSNEFTVKALIWLGEQVELEDLSRSIGHYKKAIAHLQHLPTDVQQRHVTVFKKIANAYGRGQEGHVERDQRLFSKYMKASHVLMAKTYLPPVDKTKFQGYSAFNLPE